MQAARSAALAALSALAITTWAVPAAAGTWGPDESTLDQLAHDASQSLLIRQVLKDANAKSRGSSATRSTKAAVPAHTLAPAGAGESMVRKLASAYPADRRAEVERTFSELLKGYHQIEDRFGIPRYDTAGAVAAFLAGSLMAYRNEDFPDPYFKPLVEQMRGVVGGNPAFASATPAARREMYEQMAILGMWMATTQMALKQRPDVSVTADMKRAAKGYLEQFLNVDAERVQITPQGLVIR